MVKHDMLRYSILAFSDKATSAFDMGVAIPNLPNHGSGYSNDSSDVSIKIQWFDG